MPPKQSENKKGTKRRRTKFVEQVVETDPSLQFILMPTQDDHGSSTIQTPPTCCAPYPTYPLPPCPAQTHPSFPTQNPSFPTLTQPLFPSPIPPIYIPTPFPTPTTLAVHSHSPNYRSHVPRSHVPQNPLFPTLTQPLFPSHTPPIYITTPILTPTTSVVPRSHVPQNPLFPTLTQPSFPSPTPPIYITTPFPTTTTSAVHSHSSNPPGGFMNLLSSQPSAEVFMPVPTILNQEQQHELQQVQQEQEHEQDEEQQQEDEQEDQEEEEEEDDDEQPESYIEEHKRHPERFDERAKEVLSQSDGSSSTGTMHLLDHSTAQTIWKETVRRGRSDKYYGAGTMPFNLVHNKCIYERSIDGEGGSRNVEMTPEMVALIQQLSQQMQTQNQVELEQVRTQSQKELQEMRTQLKQQQDFFMQEIRRNRELVERMEMRAARRDRRSLPQQDSANNESLSPEDGDGNDDDDEDSENA